MRLPFTVIAAASMLLGGCSSVPDAIRKPPVEAPTLEQVRQAPPQGYIGAEVRWGGTISRVENRQEETRIEIVARSLYSDGEPKQVDTSAGRFVARVSGFLDPAIYAEGRRLTVLGTIVGSEERKLDEMHYRYPVVKVSTHYLWPKTHEYDAPYGPWPYDPWYPWHRYPYY